MSREIGYVVRSLSHRSAVAISRHPLPVGEYVSARFKASDPIRGERDITVLAIVSQVSHLPIVPESILRLVGPEPKPKTPVLSYTESLLYVIAQIDSAIGYAEPPKYPIPPETPLEPAGAELLARVYGGITGVVRLGLLAPRELGVEVKIDPNRLAKHLFIAGATGSGKSNTVAILIDRLSKLGAPIIVFDVHGEYNMIPEDGDASRVVRVEARINPTRFPARMMASIIIPEPQASRQRRALVVALRRLNEKIASVKSKERVSTEEAILRLYAPKAKHQKGEDEDEMESQLPPSVTIYKNLLVNEVKTVHGIDEKKKEAVIDKIEEFFETTPISLTDEVITARVRRGLILVVDASELTDEQKRWVLKTIADSVLEKLKDARGSESIVLVIEEAPLFLDRELSHPVKYSLQRLAREGRKFGACLIVVSQRPRSLDINVVSQLQNFVFLRMVQSEDIKTVMGIADSLDESLASIIPSLPDGRAIVMGEWLGRFPALVDIDLHRGKRAGATPRILDIWAGIGESKTPAFPAEPF